MEKLALEARVKRLAEQKKAEEDLAKRSSFLHARRHEQAHIAEVQLHVRSGPARGVHVQSPPNRGVSQCQPIENVVSKVRDGVGGYLVNSQERPIPIVNTMRSPVFNRRSLYNVRQTTGHKLRERSLAILGASGVSPEDQHRVLDICPRGRGGLEVVMI